MELTRLIVKGGVISPGELRDIVNMGLEQGLDSISLVLDKILFSLRSLQRLKKIN